MDSRICVSTVSYYKFALTNKRFFHSDIMRNIMLVNPSGLSGHYMPIDLNIEHLIGYLKVRSLLSMR